MSRAGTKERKASRATRPGTSSGSTFPFSIRPMMLRAEKPRMELALAASEGRAEDEGWRVRRGRFALLGKRNHHGDPRIRRCAARLCQGYAGHDGSPATVGASACQCVVFPCADRTRGRKKPDSTRASRRPRPATGRTQDGCRLAQSIRRRKTAKPRVTPLSRRLRCKCKLIRSSPQRGALQAVCVPPCSMTWAWGLHSNGSRRNFAIVTGLAVTVRNEADQLALSPTAATAIFRIVQEALTNVTRHAEATRVHVEMHVMHDEFRLHIEDNGKGTMLDGNRRTRKTSGY
jgi:hypothetical protein